MGIDGDLPSGKVTMLFMGQFTTSMAIFYSYVKLAEGIA